MQHELLLLAKKKYAATATSMPDRQTDREERKRERERDHRHFFADTNLKPCFAGGDRRRRKKNS